jgi:hypothetical protein
VNSKEQLQGSKDKRQLQDCLEEKAFRDTLWKSISDANVFAKCNDRSTNSVFHWLGKRDYGLSLIDDIMEARPEAFFLMMQENWNNEKDGE